MPTTYECVCSRCYKGQKKVTKRTIEAHLRQDRETLKSVSVSTDLHAFLQSKIDQTQQLISHIYGGHSMLDLVSDSSGSHRVGPEGLSLCCFKVEDDVLI